MTLIAQNMGGTYIGDGEADGGIQRLDIYTSTAPEKIIPLMGDYSSLYINEITILLSLMLLRCKKATMEFPVISCQI